MRTVLASALLIVALGGCEGAPGTSSAAFGEREYTSATSSFSLRYLAPPWVVVETSSDSLELEIPAQIFGVGLDGSPPTHVFMVGHVDAPDGIDGLLRSDAAATGGEGSSTGGGDDSATGGGDPGAAEAGDTLPPGVDAPPSYLLDIDLGSPHAVALAELTHLVESRDAQLDASTVAFRSDEGAAGVVWQVQIEPGFYVRSFYVASEPTVVRATFASLFDLRSDDVDTMAGSLRTSLGSPR